MGDSARIRDCDLRAMLRLAGEAGELPPESDARRMHLLDGVRRMLGGHVGMAFVLRPDPASGALAEEAAPILVTGMSPAQEAGLRHYLLRDPNPPDPVVLTSARKDLWDGFATVRRQMVVDEAAYQRTEHFEQFRRPMDLDPQLYSALPLPDGRRLAVGICRPMNDRPFTERDCKLLDVFHEEAGRLYGRFAGAVALSPAVDEGDPRLAALPPRLKPVLNHLLQGDAEKQVAVKLGLSRHTVHEYIKVLSRKLGVSSRGELLARFVTRVPAAAMAG